MPVRRATNKRAIVLAVIITFICTSVLWGGGIVAVFIFLTWSGGLNDILEDPFHVTLHHPSEVFVAEEFEVKLIVEDATDDPRILESIDIFAGLLDGFDIIGTRPETSADATSGLPFTTLWLEKEIEVDEPKTLVIHLRAKRGGRYGGRIDVCDSREGFTSVYVRITVHPVEIEAETKTPPVSFEIDP